MMSQKYFIDQLKSNGYLFVRDNFGGEHLFLTINFTEPHGEKDIYPIYEIFLLNNRKFLDDRRNADYCGFIFEDSIYDNVGMLNLIDEDARPFKNSDVLLEQMKKSIIDRLEQLYPDFESYASYIKEQEISVWIDDFEETTYIKGCIRRTFMSGINIVNQFGEISASYYSIPRHEIINYLKNPMEAVDHFTCKYIKDNQLEIYNNYRRYHYIKQKVASIEADLKHPWHVIRNIIKGITSEQSVNIVIKKNKITFKSKIKVINLKGFIIHNDISVNGLDAKSRQEYKEVFGPYARIYPEDIICIAHGREVLYKKE